jgi:hypothetical protein
VERNRSRVKADVGTMGEDSEMSTRGERDPLMRQPSTLWYFKRRYPTKPLRNLEAKENLIKKGMIEEPTKLDRTDYVLMDENWRQTESL